MLKTMKKKIRKTLFKIGLKILAKVMLFLGYCPNCNTKLMTWSYGKYKCTDCAITYYS